MCSASCWECSSLWSCSSCSGSTCRMPCKSHRCITSWRQSWFNKKRGSHLCAYVRTPIPWLICAKCSAHVMQEIGERDVRAKAWSLPHQAVWSSGECDPSQAPGAAFCAPTPSSGYPACTRGLSLPSACPATLIRMAARLPACTLHLTL